jgi:hypothetical protein
MSPMMEDSLWVCAVCKQEIKIHIEPTLSWEDARIEADIDTIFKPIFLDLNRDKETL